MAKPLSVKVIPIGPAYGYPEVDLSCGAAELLDRTDWKNSALEIKWDAAEKTFFVQFTGKANQAGPELKNILSKRVSLEIARSSRCECGSILYFGDYTVSFKNADFVFKAEYFCPSCKTKLIAKRTGIKTVLEAWFTSLKKIKIKTSGFGLERDTNVARRSRLQKS
jgi:hypothetical protein